MKRTGIVKKIQVALMLLACPFAAFASQDGGEDYHPLNSVEDETNSIQSVFCYHWLYGGHGKYGAFDEGYSFVIDSTDESGTITLYPGDSKGGSLYSGWSGTNIVHVRWKDGRVLIKKEDYADLLDKNSGKELGNKDYIPYKETEDGFLVLYDFNMQLGDSYRHVEGYDDIIVERIDEITTIDGVSRRLLTLSNGCQVLEGIGCLNSPGLFFFYLNPLLDVDDWDYIGLYYFWTTDNKGKVKYIYMNEEIEELRINNANIQILPCDVVFDLYGRRLNGVPQRGVYIQNGRKYVVK